MGWLADPFWGGISGIAAIIGVIAGAIGWTRRHKRSKADNKITQPKSDVHALAARFIKLFRSHGIERTQIARFLGPDSGITLADLSDDDRLISKLDDKLLDNVCEQFRIRREWLDGTEARVHPCHDFYNYPHKFLGFVKNLMERNPAGSMYGVLISPSERDLQAQALLILQETVGHVGEKPIYRYHLCNNWTFTYWKARAYLTACISVAWKRNVFVHGITMPNEEIKQLAYGETLLGWQGESIWALGHKTWDPEDMALRPETFLDGVDPEPNNFGIKSGLKLWLELEAQGLMDCGFGTNARQAFQEELAKYSPWDSGDTILN